MFQQRYRVLDSFLKAISCPVSSPPKCKCTLRSRHPTSPETRYQVSLPYQLDAQGRARVVIQLLM
uniref:Uncharacterized protein n=1 Tax=Anopheles dirus TaxID=7168 RepID=A0A182NWE8_9DIPT